MKFLFNELNLVYPPISNQEGEWLWEDKEVRDSVKSSKFYMLAHRQELIFIDPQILLEEHGFLCFYLKLGDIISPLIKMSIKFVFDYMKEDIEQELEIGLATGDKIIKIIDMTKDKILYWMTPDKFLLDYSHSLIDVNLDTTFDFRIFSTFELYYVGISKASDSFARLFKDAHHGRLRILTNELQKKTDARLTDEIMILMFDIDPLNINIIDEIDEISYKTDRLSILADVEKAFIKLMDTKYNEVKYVQYPKSADGLSDAGLARYGYSVNEDISLKTKGTELKGAHGFNATKDLIMVEGDLAKIIHF